MRILRAIAAVGAAVLFTGGVAVSAELTLSVEPRSCVWGIPPHVYIDIRNNAGTELPLSNNFVLYATPSDGRAPFFATVVSRYEMSPNPELNQLVDRLAPKATTTVWMPSVGLREPLWFLDSRLQVTGTYRLSVALAEDVRGAGVDEKDLGDIDTGHVVSRLRSKHALSNEVIFTFTDPRGVDKDACDWLATRVKKLGCPLTALANDFDLAQEFVQQFPTSSYAPYFVGARRIGNDLHQLIENMNRAITAVGSHPVGDWYRFVLASMYEQSARDSRSSVPGTADNERAIALELYRQLKTDARTPGLRNAAARRIQRLAHNTDSSGPN